MTAIPVDPDTITDLADIIAQGFRDTINEHGGYTPTLIIGRAIPGGDDCGDIISVRLSGFTFDRAGCAGQVNPIFEVTVLICTDDSPTNMDAAAVDADGRRIAQIMWRAWAGMAHTISQCGLTLPTVGVIDCQEVTFGPVDIGYEFGRARGRGNVTVGLPVQPTPDGS